MEDREKFLKSEDDWKELEDSIDGPFVQSNEKVKINNDLSDISKSVYKGRLIYSVHTEGNATKHWPESERYLYSAVERTKRKKELIKKYGKKEGERLIIKFDIDKKYKSKRGNFYSFKALKKALQKNDLEIIWLR